jgi:hypothetical protein
VYATSPWSRSRHAAVVALALALVGLTHRGAHAQTLLSQGRPALASSTETTAFPAGNAVDGNTATRWSSAFGDPQWIYVDLGSVATVTRVVLNWEAAFARAYQIQVSNDASAWTTVFSTTTGTGGVNDLAVSGSGRYVRMNGTQRGTVWGYSLWEFQVFGSLAGQQPFGGTPRALPGTIQAEDYDTGGEGVAYHDTTAGNTGGQYRNDGVDIQATSDAAGGFNVGWSAPGEWLEYTVSVASAGTYAVNLRVASESAGGTAHVEIDGQNVTGTISFAATGGWQSWTTVTRGGVALSSGTHVLRLALDSGAFNVNWISLTSGACTVLPSVPTGVTSPSHTSSSVSLAWNPSTAGANCTLLYRVFQNGTQVATASTASATVGGLSPSTTYSFTVAATNEFGTSGQSSPPVSVTTNASTSAWPSRVFAPYVDVTLATPALTQLSATTGSKFYTLAFIIDGGGCSARWGGDIPLSQNYMLADINNLRAAGGNVIVSFGGAAGSELGLTCSSVASLQAQYQAVIDAYNVTWLDFDIEGGALGNTAANDRRNKAIKGLQATAASRGRELRVAYTLPVSPSGLESSGLNLLRNAVTNGTRVDVVNIMTMDYGGPQDMGAAAINAAQGTFNQIKPIFTGRTDAQIWKMIGNTPMIGVNDVTVEVFSLDNAQTVLTFSQQHNTGLIAFWSTWRDKQCPPNTPQPSNTCSGVPQAPNAFTLRFKVFTQ